MIEVSKIIFEDTPRVIYLWVLFFVWAIICLWKIFVKSGRKGWEALIPIWHIYVLFKIAKRVNPWFWFLFIIPFISYWLYLLLIVFMFTLNRTEAEVILWAIEILGYFAIAIYAVLLYWISLAFWKSRWFMLGLFLFWPIFFGILAFDNSKYILKK